jgi:hypothetical protein
VFLGALAALAAACNGPRTIRERPDPRHRPARADARRRRLGAGAAAAQAGARAPRLGRGVAAATCEGAVCSAVRRGEVALGMTEAQVMAATRTAPAAWTVRRAGRRRR